MTLCAFKGMELPCIAEAKPGDRNGFCGPHQAMLQHDYALKFRRCSKRDGIERARNWAYSRGLDTDTLQSSADKMTDTTKPMTVKTVAEVDSL